MGLNTVVFAESVIKVHLLAVNSDVHAAVVKGCHRAGREWNIILKERENGTVSQKEFL